MLDVETVRIVAAILLVLAAAGVAVLSRSIQGPSGKVVSSRQVARATEGVWIGATVLVHAWTLGVLVLPTWFYAWPVIGDFPGSTGVQVLGLVLWLIGMGLAGWAVRTLGHSMTVSVQVTEGQRLVQEGPYARIRHPIYTGNVVAAAGLALLYLSLPILSLTVVVAVLATYRGRLEDEFLRSSQAFGAAYDAYRVRTGRFLPPFRRRGRKA